MRIATALATAAAATLVSAPPAHAAPTRATVKATPNPVVVNATGGSWTTLSAYRVPASTGLIDADLTGPHGQKMRVDLEDRNLPGVWEGEIAFHHLDEAGKWTVRLIFITGMRKTAGPATTFYVKRRTALSTAPASGRSRGVSGTLKRLQADGHYAAFDKQKVRLFRWTGGRWVHTATDTTDARGRYAFAKRPARWQVRFAGTSIQASARRSG
jgi:hypothetical protein